MNCDQILNPYYTFPVVKKLSKPINVPKLTLDNSFDKRCDVVKLPIHDSKDIAIPPSPVHKPISFHNKNMPVLILE